MKKFYGKEEKRIEKLEDLEIYKKLCINQDKLPYEVADKIVADAIEDLKKIVKRWNVESNFSCIPFINILLAMAFADTPAV